ncbi:pyrroloquinoline quinone biosynthesis protein PqqF [Pseudomonas syringae]|uniref:Coenzyme PQQ synthesis protein F n=4 Tax=Pseudomonas syringae TaxID=317 RepID=A0A9Q4FG14_PSESX|nr:pyrroloquinoline quinone biosynthesis protein PqqF [Pseudomonas syringae]MCF5628838.1 pyrroloquinoline quinone biosynthesis protein PqqF [Pseudomonas syringae]
MPAPQPADTRRITLANGLSVIVCHDSRLKRSAASLRVAAGSHDVPHAWPGLAHFLEHLFFLGTERFSSGENLMTFVQRHGGQVNASTRERTTDFFFELPQAAFAQGLERLCDMLARPRMTLADQLREREVLHAEFIAWLGDVEAQHHMRLLAPINPQHPLRGFHAGNRYSLSVPNPAFQRALNDFYSRFYQAGQMTLCLSGPQSLTELETLAKKYGALFASGKKLKQQPPPPLHTRSTSPRQTGDQKHLLFACEGLPERADEAVAFLCHWLNNAQPGGLVAELIERGLTESLKASPLYQFDGHLLLDVECKGALANAGLISTLLFSWLEFFKPRWPALIEEYQRLQQRRLHLCGPLALAHHHCHALPAQLSAHGATALRVLLEQLTSGALITLAAVDKSDDQHTDWRLPSPNPFLSSTPNDGAEAALYVRWELSSPQPALWQSLNVSLKDLIEEARQAGVIVTFSAYGPFWQLQLNGLRAPMADILTHSLRRLRQPSSATLVREAEPALIPIRQLLKRLADHALNTESKQTVDDLHTLWADSRWISFTHGCCAATQALINAALDASPGTPQTTPLTLPAIQKGKRWATEASSSSEDAVLVFCPAPSESAEDQAAWRMLAHLLQAPFYQKLRVELQLGYAVFSGIRQIAGRTGMLFGVQSPTCTTEQLFQHIEAFIGALQDLVRGTDLPEQIQALSAQFDPMNMPDQQHADLQWHACLAGHQGDHAQALRSALSNLDTHSLLAASDQLIDATGGWLIVANRPAPAASI